MAICVFVPSLPSTHSREGAQRHGGWVGTGLQTSWLRCPGSFGLVISPSERVFSRPTAHSHDLWKEVRRESTQLSAGRLSFPNFLQSNEQIEKQPCGNGAQ